MGGENMEPGPAKWHPREPLPVGEGGGHVPLADPGDSELGEFVWVSPRVSESVSGQRNHLFLKDHSVFQPTDPGS